MKRAKFERVLVVDDRDIDCFVAQYMIRKNAFADEVVIRNSVDDALLLLRTATEAGELPNVILLDIRMPDKSGFDFLDEFLMLPSLVQAHCSIVMYSTSALDEDVARMRAYPVIKHFFVKPVSEKKLAEVANVLGTADSN